MDLTTLLLFIIAGAFMAYGAIRDWNEFCIPYVTIGVVVVAGIVYQGMTGGSIPLSISVSAITGLSLLLVSRLLSYTRGREVLGYGDIQLIMASVLWFDVERLPVFFVLAGVAGVCLAYFSRWTYFPFVPGIGLAWFLTMLL